MHQNILRHTHLFISIYRSLFLATTFDDAGRILECSGAFQLANSDLINHFVEKAVVIQKLHFRMTGS